MPLFSETQEKIFGDIMFEVVDTTTVTRNSPGGKMRALTEAVSRKLGRMYRRFDLNIAQAFLSGASGQYLDFLGSMMGVERLGEEPARITAADNNIKFFTETGTFGDLFDISQPLLIPSGTIISTASNAGVRYRTIGSTIFLATASEGFVSVESVTTGAVSNVGANQLRFHDFVDYDDISNGTLKVTNVVDVVQARDVEGEANFKFRIANQLFASENANETSLRIAALEIPGVADIILLPFSRGIGTVDLLVQSVTPTVSASLLAAVQQAVSGVSAAGAVPLARKPTEIGISLTATIKFKKKLAPTEEADILTAAKDNIDNYINDLDIGEEFVAIEVIERILSTSDEIKDLGEPNKRLDSVFIYRPSRLEDNKVRSTLIGNFDTQPKERVIIENQFAGNTPILVRSTL